MTIHPFSYEPYRVPSWILDLPPYQTMADRQFLRASADHHGNLALCYAYLMQLDPRWEHDFQWEARAAWSFALDLLGRE